MGRNSWETDNKQLRGFSLKQHILLVLIFIIANRIQNQILHTLYTNKL